MSTVNEIVTDRVRDYYGKVLQGNKDLKTTACCTADSVPAHHKEILGLIEDEILDRFYGCGSPIPDELQGKTVLDLGCGTGRDSYLLSKLVGPEGFVIGIDMTDEQLEIANKNLEKQMRNFGFNEPNIEFKKGYIENLNELGIDDNSVDVVISNCVLNLSPDKKAVYSEIFRVLKTGGELYFSDVFADRRIPNELKDDPVLYGECLSGAMYTEDFRRMLRQIGCPDYRILTSSKIEIENEEIEQKVGMINFYSMTVRVFKLDALEDICEDYGQVAIYNGSIDQHPHSFDLDDHHTFYTGKPMLVCGNTAAMVGETRFKDYFTVTGDRSVHYGAFDCGDSPVPTESKDIPAAACC